MPIEEDEEEGSILEAESAVGERAAGEVEEGEVVVTLFGEAGVEEDSGWDLEEESLVARGNGGEGRLEGSSSLATLLP